MYALRFAAILIGIVAVTLLPFVLVGIGRCKLYKSFYRYIAYGLAYSTNL